MATLTPGVLLTLLQSMSSDSKPLGKTSFRCPPGHGHRRSPLFHPLPGRSLALRRLLHRALRFRKLYLRQSLRP
ncbi:hypothetical protein KSP39_PZI017885 [Platanthera zijinensis]|uniref:Uncharacterized protein n=1 Tax=Platanthera zijinensis TaxID=2320716 RepID=A0AAP0B5J3_9ASPA